MKRFVNCFDCWLSTETVALEEKMFGMILSSEKHLYFIAIYCGIYTFCISIDFSIAPDDYLDDTIVTPKQ